MEQFDCMIQYCKGERKVRHAVPARSKELSDHLKMCEKGWGGDRIIVFKLNVKEDGPRKLDDFFSRFSFNIISN